MIKRIILHHSDGDPKVWTPLKIAQYHISKPTDPFAGIAYHFCVSDLGLISWCNSLTQVSTHTAGNNVDSIGICLLGSFRDAARPPQIQLEATAKLVNILEIFFGRLTLFGHKDIGDTRCPGDQWNVWRNNLDELINPLPSSLNDIISDLEQAEELLRETVTSLKTLDD